MDTDLKEAIKKQLADSGLTAEEIVDAGSFYSSTEYKDLRNHATERAIDAIGRVTALIEGVPRRAALTLDTCEGIIIGTVTAMSLSGAPDSVVDVAVEALFETVRQNVAHFRKKMAADKVVVDEKTGTVTYAD